MVSTRDMIELGLYRFLCDFGSAGVVEAVLISTHHEINEIIGVDVYFGDVLGKHSDIQLELQEEDFELMSNDQDLITKLLDVFGSKTISGYNPFDYIDEDE